MENRLDPEVQSLSIQSTIKKAIENQFPIIGKHQTLELVKPLEIVDNLDDQDFPAQRELKLSGKSWQAPVYGHFRLRDNKTGTIIDEVKDLKVVNIPKITDRFSMLVDGNEYTTMNQFRLKSGIYTRKKANDEMESQFNLAKGYNFKMMMDPADGIFYLYIANQKFHLYTLLHAFGFPESDMRKSWGREIFAKNQQSGLNEDGKEIPLMWEKLKREKLPFDKALEALKDYFANNTSLSVETTQITLGKGFDRVSPEALLYTSSKLLKVLRGDEPEDERDSLVFKDLYTVDDQLEARFEKTQPNIRKNLQFRADNKQSIREIISPDTYSKDIKSFFTQGDLSNPSPQTNPVEMIGEWRKTTITGAGGIQSDHAITFKTRDIHPTHLGFLDPLNTPESGKVGVTLPLSMHVIKQGKNILTPIIAPNGEQKYVTPAQFYQMKIGFPDQHADGKPKGVTSKAMFKGQSVVLKSDEIEGYVINPLSMFAWTTNLVPFLGNNSGNRALVAAKMVTQSVPLKEPESPLVKVIDDYNEPLDKRLGNYLKPKVPKGFGMATVQKIEPDYIHISNDKGEKTKVGLYRDFPLNQESYIHSEPVVSVGDKIAEGAPLANTNFTDKQTGDFAPGLNVNVAYMPWHGYNFEDGIVVTESLAKKFTSMVMLKKNLQVNKDGILDTKKFTAYYPKAMSQENLGKLDETGVIKEGMRVKPGETLVAYLQPADLTDTERVLKQMNRVLSNPFRNKSLTWDGDHEGVVTHVRKNGNTFQVHVKEEQPLKIGDKLAARYGDKGIVTKIIPDAEAPHTKEGTRIDMMVNIHGVAGRMNMGQILEAAAGRISMKTGKPYLVKNFSDTNYLDDIMAGLKREKIEPDEVLLDGKDGKPFEKPIYWGNKHYLKLMHVVDHKYKARGLPGSYDADERPAHGDEGGQSIDPLQMYSYLAHGARENLYEISAVKGQKNDEYWRALQLGLPTPPPQKNFVFDKMMSYIKAAGVNVDKKGYNFKLLPATTADVLKGSAGELKNPAHLLRGKDLAALPGGLFDKELTGGMRGTNWTHFKLEEPIPHPLYEPAIKSLLGLNSTQFEKIIAEDDRGDVKGSVRISRMLAAIDVDKELLRAQRELKVAAPTKINALNKKVRYLQVLQDHKLTPVSAYMMDVVPVLPPLYRPIYPLPSGDIQASPINYHYKDVAVLNQQIRAIKDSKILDDMEMNRNNRKTLYYAVKALIGLSDPITFTTRKYEGLLTTLAGDSPKQGFIQNKVWSKRQDLSARSTITVEPSLGVDQVGIPDVMLKSIMKPFIQRELVWQGYKPLDAVEAVKNWTPVADQALNNAIKRRPVMLNRAPSLHKHAVQAFWPVRFEGQSIRVNPLVAKGFNFDFDGDTMSVHVPVSEKAVEEAKAMLPSKNLYKAGDRGHMINIEQDYQLGLYYLTQPGPSSGKSFKSVDDAREKIKDPTATFTYQGKEMSLGQWDVNDPLPAELKDYTRPMNSKNVKMLIDKLYEKYPGYLGTCVDAWKELGRKYAVQRGSTISITDLVIDRSFRDKILKEYEAKITPAMNKYEVTQVYVDAKQAIENKQDELLKGKNNFYDMLQAGSTGRKGQVTQILSLPGVVLDVHGEPIPHPIKRGWAEGLDTFDYWNQSYGARKGVVDRSVNTQDSGALNKELLFTTKSLLVTEEDCNTPEGIMMPVDSKEVMDRFLAQEIPGVGKRGQLVNGESVQKAKTKHIEKLPVRSSLTCEADNGVCQKCYGLMANGQLPRLGENVGVIDSEALTERSTQLTMQTFHTGGTAGGTSAITLGFPRLEELLHVPQKIRDAGVMTRDTGTVTSIRDNPAGGKNLLVGSTEYYVPRERKLTVTEGQQVKRGDALSDGSLKPQDISELRSHLDAQQYIADEINKVYENKYSRKTFETVLRGISNNAEVLDIPVEAEDKADFLRGDTVAVTRLRKLNRELVAEGKPVIDFKPFFKSIETLPLQSEDWLSRLTTNRLKQTIQDAATKGQSTNVKGIDPMAAYLYGLDFGKDIDPTKKQFY
jgi:DNA-directed RNA polymerase subunit beta'